MSPDHSVGLREVQVQIKEDRKGKMKEGKWRETLTLRETERMRGRERDKRERENKILRERERKK